MPNEDRIQSPYDALFKSVEARSHKMCVLEKLGYYYDYFWYMAGWMLPEEKHRYKNILSRYERFNAQRNGRNWIKAENGADWRDSNGQTNNRPRWVPWINQTIDWNRQPSGIPRGSCAILVYCKCGKKMRFVQFTRTVLGKSLYDWMAVHIEIEKWRRVVMSLV